MAGVSTPWRERQEAGASPLPPVELDPMQQVGGGGGQGRKRGGGVLPQAHTPGAVKRAC